MDLVRPSCAVLGHSQPLQAHQSGPADSGCMYVTGYLCNHLVPQCEHGSGSACPACQERIRQPAHAPLSLSSLNSADALGRADSTFRHGQLCACRHACAGAALLVRKPRRPPLSLAAAAEQVRRDPTLPCPTSHHSRSWAPAPLGRECGGAGAAGDGVHAFRDARERAPVLQIAVHELQARRRAQQLRGLAGAAAQRAHAVAALRTRLRLSAGAGTQCARACAAGVLAAWLRKCSAPHSDACGCMRARQTGHVRLPAAEPCRAASCSLRKTRSKLWRGDSACTRPMWKPGPAA